ncbi:Adenosylhomocysteinase [Actinacidiphila bryophytorum]|uniref:Adenosylhomocysteinase n=1 Tax=Actinacidiphila bryophytorum TaxID=1436133 RepID=A0A9W4H2C1_9ACTN|nr:Adenosylhomocysteinase [Actinacidiphila bryophytorum]
MGLHLRQRLRGPAADPAGLRRPHRPVGPRRAPLRPVADRLPPARRHRRRHDRRSHPPGVLRRRRHLECAAPGPARRDLDRGGHGAPLGGVCVAARDGEGRRGQHRQPDGAAGVRPEVSG